MSDIPQKSTAQRARILALLRERGSAGITNLELNRLCSLRYTARISELRTQGVTIRTQREGESVFRFILLAEPALPKPLPKYEPRKPAPEQPTLFAEARS